MREGLLFCRVEMYLWAEKDCRAFWNAIRVAVVNRHDGHIGPETTERIVSSFGLHAAEVDHV